MGWLLCAALIILWGCFVFTNPIDWLVRRTSTSESAVGRIFAVLDTTLAQTAIPVSAFCLPTGVSKTDLGMGAILAAHFTQKTLILPTLAILLLVFSR
ncbi:MAG: hypothetical protein WBO24_10680 [Nitrospirales bacterium]